VQHEISEIQITPIIQRDGLVAFASFLLDGDIYLGGVAIYTRPGGGFRLVYPTRKSRAMSFSVYNPIRKEVARQIEQTVITRYEEVTKTYDRHDSTDTRG
jgi:DNA-binding cell septation regulator SpoVG